jgi:hypothetical protein
MALDEGSTAAVTAFSKKERGTQTTLYMHCRQSVAEL